MKNVKNNFFKWLYQLTKLERNELIRDFEHEKEARILMIKNSFNKFRDWKKKKKYSEQDFDRHRRKIQKDFFEDKDITTEIHESKLKLESFLIKTETGKNKLLHHQILFESAKNRNFKEAYFYHLEKREEANKVQPNRSFDYLHEAFKINYHRFFHSEFEKHKFQTTKNYQTFQPEEVLYQSWQDMQLAFLIIQFRLGCEIEYNKWIIQDKKNILHRIDSDFLKQTIAQIDLEQSVVLKIYATLYSWMCEKDLTAIEPIKNISELSRNNITAFPLEEQVSLLLLLINCFGKILKDTSDSKPIYEAIEGIAVFGFENNIFGAESAFDENSFLSIYDSVYKNNPTFAKKMMTDYIHYLSSENDKIWILAIIEIRALAQEKAYYQCLQKLNDLPHHNDYRFAIRRFVMVLQYFYELKYAIQENPTKYNLTEHDEVSDENFEATIENIYRSIENANFLQKPSEEEIELLKQFITAVKMLFYKTSSIDETKQYVKEHFLYAKSWLLAMIDRVEFTARS